MSFAEIEKLLRKKGLDAKSEIIVLLNALPESTDFTKYINDFSIWLMRYDNRSFVPQQFRLCQNDYKDFERLLIRRDFEKSIKRGLSATTRKTYYLTNIDAFCVSKEDVVQIAAGVESAVSWSQDTGDRMTDREDLYGPGGANGTSRGTSTATPTGKSNIENADYKEFDREIIRLLKLPFTNPDDPALLDRKKKLVLLFYSYPLADTPKLLERLKSRKNPDNLTKLFLGKISTPTRTTLLGILYIAVARWEEEKAAAEAREKAILQKAQQDVAQLPTNNPRYLDSIYEGVAFYFLNGAFEFYWNESGVKKNIVFSNDRVIQTGNDVYIQKGDVLYPDKDSAMAAVRQLETSAPTLKFFAVYKGDHGVIVPTTVNQQSMPLFFQIDMPGLRKNVGATANDIRSAFHGLANYINPVPFTQVDQYGNLTASADPFSLLALLHLGRRAANSNIPLRLPKRNTALLIQHPSANAFESKYKWRPTWIDAEQTVGKSLGSGWLEKQKFKQQPLGGQLGSTVPDFFQPNLKGKAVSAEVKNHDLGNLSRQTYGDWSRQLEQRTWAVSQNVKLPTENWLFMDLRGTKVNNLQELADTVKKGISDAGRVKGKAGATFDKIHFILDDTIVLMP